MVLNKYVDFKIKGKTYKLCYPIAQAWKMEQSLSDHSIFAAIAAIGAGAPRLQDLFAMLKYALIGGQPDMKEEAAETLVLDAFEESPQQIYPSCLQALRLAGLLPGVKKDQAAPGV